MARDWEQVTGQPAPAGKSDPSPRQRRLLRRGPRIHPPRSSRPQPTAGAGPDDAAQAAQPAGEWHDKTPGEQAAAWAELRAWVAWLYDRYELSVEDRLPRCWARHPGLVEELGALKTWREEIYSGPQPSGQAARYWHAELRQVLHAATSQYALGCRTGHRGSVRLAAEDPALLREWEAAHPLAGVPRDRPGRRRRPPRRHPHPNRSSRRGTRQRHCGCGPRHPRHVLQRRPLARPSRIRLDRNPRARALSPRATDRVRPSIRQQRGESTGPVDHDLTRRAEQAVLGAMITDRQVAARLGYLEPGDFTDPRHRWVFGTVRQLSVTLQSTPGDWRELIARTARRSVTRKYLDELVEACPDPAHGPAYGAMLVQAAVYRQARDHADEMYVQAALLRAEGSRLIEASAPGAGRAAGLGALLAEVARAVRGHTAVLSPPAPSSPVGPTPETALAEPARPAPATQAAQREELVLSAVLQEHPQAGQILSYLPAAAFTSSKRQEIFRAARRLNRSGRPVDELTVSWELATHSAVAAVLSPESAPQPQVPHDYIGRLAGTDVGVGPSPLRTAHELDVQLRYRASRDLKPAAGTVGSPPLGGKDRAQQTTEAGAPGVPAPAEAVPLIRPQHAAEDGTADPEHKR